MNASANASAGAGAADWLNSTDDPLEYDDMVDYDSGTVVCLDKGGGDAAAWVREAVRLLLALAVLLSNCFIVAALLRAWTRDGRPLGRCAAASYLVLNLAVADALVGLSMVYSWIQDDVCYVYEQMTVHPVPCLMGHITTQFFDCSSALTIIVIAVDRAMSVSHTARCRNFFDSRRTLAAICCIWQIGFFLALTTMIPGVYVWRPNAGCELSEVYEETMLWGTVAIVLITLFSCYWRIHRVTLQMLRRGSLPAPRKQAGTKAARMLLMIFAWDSCAYFPLLIVTVVSACGVHVSQNLMDVSSNLTMLTFLADPYIYAYNNQHTKKAILDFVACFRRDPRDELEPVSRRESIAGTQMRRFRHIISTITNTSSGSDEEKEKANKQSPMAKRNSLITREL